VSTSPLSYLYNEELYQVPPLIVVVTGKPWEKFSEDERSLLSKILGSVKVGLSSVRVLTKASVSTAELMAIGSPRILIFGSKAEIAPYQLVQAQGFSVIRADDLTSLDDAKKKSLWLALKSMFAL
jgi:hypothetical protein